MPADSTTQNGTHSGKPERFAAVVIFLLTLAYLCLELPFSVDLLNGVGSVVTPAELQRLEIAGRLISGLALVLLVWQFVVLPLARAFGRTRRWTVVVCLVITAPIMFAVYRGEGALVSRPSPQDGAGSRQLAFAAVLLAQGVERGQVEIKGMPFTAETRKDPDAMAFMALLPLMASEMHDIRARLLPVATGIVQQRLDTEAGGAAAFYDRTYVPAINVAKQQYDRYRNGAQEYNRKYAQYQHGLSTYQQTMSSADQRGKQAYWDYRKRLAHAIHSQGPAPAWECPAIRRKVERRYGIDLPRGWNCWAEAPFAAAVAARYRDAARDRLTHAQHELKAHRPHDMGATFASFLQQPEVHNHVLDGWRKDGITVPADVSLADQSVDSWSKLVYQPQLAAHATDIVNHFAGHVDDFRPGGSYYDAGHAAHELLVIPAIALFFSLLGALVHIVKILVEASVIIRPQKAVSWRSLLTGHWRQVVPDKPAFALRFGFLLAGLVLVSLPMVLVTPVTRSPVFAGITQAMRTNPDGGSTRRGAAAAVFARWAVQTEAAVYPFNAKLRDAVDRVFDFEQSWLVRIIAAHSEPLSSPLNEASAHTR